MSYKTYQAGLKLKPAPKAKGALQHAGPVDGNSRKRTVRWAEWGQREPRWAMTAGVGVYHRKKRAMDRGFSLGHSSSGPRGVKIRAISCRKLPVKKVQNAVRARPSWTRKRFVRTFVVSQLHAL